jgi:hypothetical protein
MEGKAVAAHRLALGVTVAALCAAGGATDCSAHSLRSEYAVSVLGLPVGRAQLRAF